MSILELVIRYYFDPDWYEEIIRSSLEECNQMEYQFVQLFKLNPQKLSPDLSRKRNKILKIMERQYLLKIDELLGLLNKKMLIEICPESLMEDYMSEAIELGKSCSIEGAYKIIASIPSDYRLILLSKLDNVNAILKAITDKNSDNFNKYFSQPGENYHNVLLFCGMINNEIKRGSSCIIRDAELVEDDVPHTSYDFGGFFINNDNEEYESSAVAKENIKETFKSLLKHVRSWIVTKYSNRIFDIIYKSPLSDTLYLIFREAIYELEGMTELKTCIPLLSTKTSPFSSLLEITLNSIDKEKGEGNAPEDRFHFPANDILKEFPNFVEILWKTMKSHYKGESWIHESTTLDDFKYVFGLIEDNPQSYHKILWTKRSKRGPNRQALLRFLTALGYNEIVMSKEKNNTCKKLNDCFSLFDTKNNKEVTRGFEIKDLPNSSDNSEPNSETYDLLENAFEQFKREFQNTSLEKDKLEQLEKMCKRHKHQNFR